MRTVTPRILVGLLLVMGAVPLHAEDRAGPDAAPPRRSQVAAAYLDQEWAKPGGWNGIEAWQRFVAVDVLIDHERRTGDKRWGDQIDAAVRNRTGLYLNDDALWAVIANVHAWRRNNDPELLDYAGSTYRRLVAGYWDNRCGGGLWWDPARTYKNAITNELLFYASTQLYLATGQQGYRDWALRSWSWIEGSSMIGADGLVNDGLDAQCRNNGQPRFTYNQGVLIGGLNDLAGITGDPAYRAVAVKTALAAMRGLSTPEGILREPVDAIGSDGLMFKGIFAYHLGHLLDAMPDGSERGELMAWARGNADAVWRSSASGTAGVDGDWSGGTSRTGPAAQASGIAMLVAAGD
ncbi:glycoside hydrolase family 76 protein [Novosphingobium sp. P6W]|uniref:glycoside hydrolase family 76 protein n=1 Tax=Novosphingobium sp. P6W TaxID=1609758 RepID=UPI0005C2AA99|nr:glycoside hydrolase family 76 protein [Novosphingobium sp. P6W]AXB79281.1 glycosyl hydrolase [Novosphingobium sp. P6W]KIS31833.1 glycosyl hydrolase [Novosphingobium sp. P6W]